MRHLTACLTALACACAGSAPPASPTVAPTSAAADLEASGPLWGAAGPGGPTPTRQASPIIGGRIEGDLKSEGDGPVPPPPPAPPPPPPADDYCADARALTLAEPHWVHACRDLVGDAARLAPEVVVPLPQDLRAGDAYAVEAVARIEVPRSGGLFATAARYRLQAPDGRLELELRGGTACRATLRLDDEIVRTGPCGPPGLVTFGLVHAGGRVTGYLDGVAQGPPRRHAPALGAPPRRDVALVHVGEAGELEVRGLRVHGAASAGAERLDAIARQPSHFAR